MLCPHCLVVPMGPTWPQRGRRLRQSPSPKLEEMKGLDSHGAKPGAQGREPGWPWPGCRCSSSRPHSGRGLGTGVCSSLSQGPLGLRPGPAAGWPPRHPRQGQGQGGTWRMAPPPVFSLLEAVGVRMTSEPADHRTWRASGGATAMTALCRPRRPKPPVRPQDGEAPLRVFWALPQRSTTCRGGLGTDTRLLRPGGHKPEPTV